jgi:hypothetical protein
VTLEPRAMRKPCSAASIAGFLTPVPDVAARWAGVALLLLAAGCYPLHWARKEACRGI